MTDVTRTADAETERLLAGLPPCCGAVLAAIQKLADTHSVCSASRRVIGREAKLSIRSVEIATADLETARLLDVDRGRGRGHVNRYRLLSGGEQNGETCVAANGEKDIKNSENKGEIGETKGEIGSDGPAAKVALAGPLIRGVIGQRGDPDYAVGDVLDRVAQRIGPDASQVLTSAGHGIVEMLCCFETLGILTDRDLSFVREYHRERFPPAIGGTATHGAEQAFHAAILPW